MSMKKISRWKRLVDEKGVSPPPPLTLAAVVYVLLLQSIKKTSRWKGVLPPPPLSHFGSCCILLLQPVGNVLLVGDPSSITFNNTLDQHKINGNIFTWTFLVSTLELPLSNFCLLFLWTSMWIVSTVLESLCGMLLPYRKAYADCGVLVVTGSTVPESLRRAYAEC